MMPREALHDDDRHNSTAADQLTGEFIDDLVCIMGPVNVSCVLAYSYMRGLRVQCGLYVRLIISSVVAAISSSHCELNIAAITELMMRPIGNSNILK